MVAKGKKFIRLYKEKGVDSSRVLIKLPCTWEGIRAGEILEKEGQRTTHSGRGLRCGPLQSLTQMSLFFCVFRRSCEHDSAVLHGSGHRMR